MPRPKATVQDIKERKDLARSFKDFRKNYLFTQKRLAEMLDVSRRTVQQIEAAKVTPQAETVRSFRTFKKKHEREADTDYS